MHRNRKISAHPEGLRDHTSHHPPDEASDSSREMEARAREAEERISRTELGKKLIDLRRRAIAKGMQLRDVDEILEEIRRDRGYLPDE